MKKLILFFIFLASFCFASMLEITEVMYNPEGNDTGREWIEVINKSGRTLNILSGKNGWRIDDGKTHLFEENLTIYPNEIFIIIQDRNKFLQDYPNFQGKTVLANFSLKNENGMIKILNENKEILAQVSYQSSCGGNGNGYSIFFENNLCQENKILKGTPGSLKIQNIEERTKNNEETSVNKQIDQQTEIKNNQNYQSQINNDQKNLSEEKLTSNLEKDNLLKPTTLIINEFYPNSEGNDEGKEFIELYNYGDQEIDLDGFVLEIGNKKIKLKGNIDAGEYYLITNKDYNFSIRNKGEKISLYYNNEKIFEISYQGKAPEGKSFSRQNANKWQFTLPTPGKENVFIEDVQDKKPELNIFSNENFKQNNYNFPVENELANIYSQTQQKVVSTKNKDLIIIISSLILILVLTFFTWLFL